MNILWIMTDQHRADCLGFMGNPVVQTPHLDRLAESSVVFDKAFCQSPACMASRAVLFTGRYPAAARVRGMGILPPSETTFPEVLRRHGFRTAAFGKVHLTPEQYTLRELHADVPTLDWRRFAKDGMLTPVPDDPCKENYGFEVYSGCEDILRGRHREWLREKSPALLDRKATPLLADGPGDLRVSPYPSVFDHSTFIAASAAEFVRAQDGGKPWFTFCSFIAPHPPFEAPEDQIVRYNLEDIPIPAVKGGVDPAFIPLPAAMAIGEMQRYPDLVKRHIARHYFASISLIDDGVGCLLDALEHSGQKESTMIVFTSDHGEFLGNHDLLRKPSLHYDETLRVPLLIHLPGRKLTPRREGGLVELADLYPTLLSLLDVPITPGVQGRDFSAALRSGGRIGREDIYSDMYDITPQRFGKLFGPYMAVQTLRTDRWKLNIYPTAGQQYGQLFNLQEDPDESRNFYGENQHRDVREELLWRLAQRCHRNTDPMPPYLTQF
ncbi:MAG: sulfatase-like hydrolase/transferase [Lentisphaerae bacterium]|nr:sulfatase-like hydrolase/transferase [Lentisphaerota bacterium]